MNRLRLHHDEDGMAMMTALLAIVILSGLVIVFMNRAVTETRASGNSRDHETSIHVAESAADNQISFLNDDDLHVTEDRDGNRIEVDAAALVDEEAWALDLLDVVRPDGANMSDAWVQSDSGQAYAVRPYDIGEGEPLNVVYAVGAVPSFGVPNAKVRVIKLQVDQDNFIPEFALLTEGELTFGGNASIVVPGCIPSPPEQALATCKADVHTNQAFKNPGNASTIQGRVSQASGSCPSGVTATNGCVDTDDGVESKQVPQFVARDFYNRTSMLNPDPDGQSVEWFDLCPPGKPAGVVGATVRSPSVNGPCATGSTQVWPDPSAPTSDFRGWKWQAGEWRGGSIGAGVFYVYHADAKVTGSSGTSQRAVSIFVEQDPANKAGSGSLDLSGNPKMQAAMESLLFVVDADLDMQGTPTAGSCGVTPGAMSGFIGVGEQLKTQGTVELRGSIIVRDVADDHNLVKRNNSGVSGTMCLEFDANLAVDFSGIWVITFWNEL